VTTIKEAFGPATPVATTTLGGLAASSAQTGAAVYQMAAVDNSVSLYLDALVSVTATTNATTAPTGSPVVEVYAYGSPDGGATYPDNVTGVESVTNAGATIQNMGNLRLIGLVNMQTVVNGTTRAGPFSVAQAFGGTVPTRWGLVLRNNTGQALAAGNTAATNAITWTGVSATSA